MNFNGNVPFLIKMLDTIVRVGKKCPNGEFSWFCDSSSGVDPVLILTPGCVGIAQVVLKKKNNQTTNRGWKEETDKHRFRTTNAGSEVGTLKHSCMYLCVDIVRTQ